MPEFISKNFHEPQHLAIEAEMKAEAAAQAERSATQELHEAWQTTWANLRPNEIVVVDGYADDLGLNPTYRSDAVQRAADILGDAGLNFYRADERLVRITHLKETKREKQNRPYVPEGSVALTPITREDMSRFLWEHARLLRLTPDRRRGRVTRNLCSKTPAELVTALLTVDTWGDRLPTIRAISTCPQVDMETGVAHLTEGYDSTSKIYYDLGGVQFQDGPERPDLVHVETAANVLIDLIGEFPVAAMDEALPPAGSAGYDAAVEQSREISRAAIVALVLTAAVHTRCLHPLWGGTAYNPGSGKSTVGSMMSCIITGKESPIVYPWPANKDENEKQLTTVALMKHPFIVFDNAEGRINAPKLNILVSEGQLNARQFGTIDKELHAECMTLFYINGNGLRISADLVRRTILFCLNSFEERSSDAVYNRDIEAYTLEHRVEIWKSIITILRYSIQRTAELATQFPMRALAGFEAWSRVVRRACLLCGLEDPARSQDLLYAADPERQELETVIAAWQAAYGEQDICVSDVIRAAGQSAGGDPSVQTAAERLLDAWSDAIPRRGELSARIIGAWLQRRQRRPVNGWMIAHVGKGERGAYWRLVRHGRPASAPKPAPAPSATESSVSWQPWDSARDA